MFVKKIVGEFARKVFDVRAGINPISGSVLINNLDLRVHSTARYIYVFLRETVWFFSTIEGFIISSHFVCFSGLVEKNNSL